MTKDEKMDLILTEITSIKKKLFGNGEQGLCEKVRNLEYWRKQITGFPKIVDHAFHFVLTLLVIWSILK